MHLRSSGPRFAATNFIHFPIDKTYRQDGAPETPVPCSRFVSRRDDTAPLPFVECRKPQHNDHPIDAAAAEQLESCPQALPPTTATAAATAANPDAIPNHGYRNHSHAASSELYTSTALNAATEAQIPYVFSRNPLIVSILPYKVYSHEEQASKKKSVAT